MRSCAGIFVAILFSLLYVSLYPVLTGVFAIHLYPSWPPALAGAYVAGGSFLQMWFCYRYWPAATGRSLVSQVLTGIGYLAALLLASNGVYQT